ncbi:hypothetical protein EGI22_04165 [Lacihabitans sp. LS3-19]|uniref:hypothetical protein n=1 Tax=Lacihabitans sp. LS3-19 TaxID=2487335 RepID=UPI0020CEA4F8|nr:hypothetical protein [Lacihabitans sp. LS3-19]MCP9767092.1 hypothetical protein [Lacihabitans sp. LS3-19]
MKKYKKELIDKFINGSINPQELSQLRELMAEDTAFFERFELKKAMSEIEEIQLKVKSDNEVDDFFLRQESAKKRIWYFSSAAVIIGLISVFVLLKYRQTDTANSLTLNANFYQTNFEPIGGNGFADIDSLNQRFYLGQIKFNFIKDQTLKDTTYQIINQDSANVFIPTLPVGLDSNSFFVNYDFNLRKTYLIIKKDTFELKESKTIEKLIKK